MQQILLTVRKVTVLIRPGTDQVSLHLEGPTPFPELQKQNPEEDYKPCLNLEARKGFALEWLNQMGISKDLIEIIHFRNGVL